MILLATNYDKGGFPITTAFGVSSLRIKERPPDVDGGCEYIQQTVAYRRQVLVVQLGGFTARC